MKGKTSSNILINLFKGYLSTPDKELNMYIKQKKNDYEKGRDITLDKIMVMAKNQYKSLVRGEEWNAPSRKQKEILALTAQSDTMSKKNQENLRSKKKYECKKVALKDVKKPNRRR